ncbi:MAG TPA: hypothetical protein VHQ89_12790 [Gaiellaceae bacterium]|jgi:hypothetical protein|nr:hypothetical protein [Gaiellaceae bacterium]
MRHAFQLAVVCVAALLLAAPALSRPDTTNAPAIFTVKVTVTNTKIGMHPAHAVRGSTVTFILTNRGTKTRTFVIGDVKRGPGLGQGFKQILKPNQQFTKVMFLDYRGVMKFSTRAGSTVIATGSFKIN